MSASATAGAVAALECDLRALRSIHRHLCILSEDYADWSAGNYLGDAANSTALAIGRLADLRGSKDSTAKRPDGQTKTGGAA